MNLKKSNLLFIIKGPLPPPKDLDLNRYNALSEDFTGDVVSGTWSLTSEEVDNISSAMGDFKFYPVPRNYKNNLFFSFSIFLEIYIKAYKLCKQNSYDAIFIYGPYFNGLLAFVLRALVRVPVVIDVPGHPVKGFMSLTRDKLNYSKSILAKYIARFVCKNADAVKILYPSQLDSLGIDLEKNIKHYRIFHCFVPVSKILSFPVSPKTINSPYIVTLGTPWYLKGVDILIKAFKEISSEFPDLKLKIYGFEVKDRSYFNKLAKDFPQIELGNPIDQKAAYESIEKSQIFVLASRTEAMGRVLLEAMSLRTPIIASNVDGIPHYVEHNKTGLLFESENHKDLANKIRKLLTDKDLANTLSNNAYDKVRKDYSEVEYINNLKEILKNLNKEK